MAVFRSGTAVADYILNIDQPRRAAAELRAIFAAIKKDAASLGAGGGGGAAASLNQQSAAARSATLLPAAIGTQPSAIRHVPMRRS